MPCRPDHNLQDIRAKIFPLRRRKINAPEVAPPISLPVKRKERSLSSLVVSTPKVPMQTGLTGRRTKAVARRTAALRGSSFAAEDTVKREDSAEDHPLSSSSPESQNRSVRNKMQVLPLSCRFNFLGNEHILELLCAYSFDTGFFDC